MKRLPCLLRKSWDLRQYASRRLVQKESIKGALRPRWLESSLQLPHVCKGLKASERRQADYGAIVTAELP